MINDYVISVVRTLVPVIVGSALVWLGARTGVLVDEQWSASLTVIIVPIVTGGYYAAVRAAEVRWPWVGRLLGWKVSPTYPPTP